MPEGAIYALVGRNGAGKTTLIKLLMNILRPSAGAATVLDLDARRLGGKGFRRIGYVSENQELPGWMTVGAMLEFCRPFYPEWDGELAARLVAEAFPTARSVVFDAMPLRAIFLAVAKGQRERSRRARWLRMVEGEIERCIPKASFFCFAPI